MESGVSLGEYNEFGRRIVNTVPLSPLLSPAIKEPRCTFARSVFSCFALCTAYQCADTDAFYGGDFYDVLVLPNGGIALFIGDASGKGQGVAMRAAEVRYLLRAFLRTGMEPALAVSQVNDILCQQKQFNTFTTLTIAIVYPDRQCMEFIMAGGEPPLLFCADGSMAESPEAKGGLPLGVLPDQAYAVVEVVWKSGDLLLLFTDGITEARGEEALFGTDGIQSSVHDLLTHEKTKPTTVDTITNGVFIKSGQFHTRPLRDDRCLMVAQFCR